MAEPKEVWLRPHVHKMIISIITGIAGVCIGAGIIYLYFKKQIQNLREPEFVSFDDENVKFLDSI